MLADIHESLTKLLYVRGGLPASDIDVRFEKPTQEWIDRLTRPTVAFFLFNVEENTDLRHNDFATSRGNGHAARRLAPRRIDLHYLVTALATDESDEHQIIWRVLATLIRFRELPSDVLTTALQTVEPAISTRMADEEKVDLIDLWGGLNAIPHAALHYIVTAPLDLDITIESPLVLTRTTRYVRLQGATAPMDTAMQIGGVVRGKDGSPVAGAQVFIDGSGSSSVFTAIDGTYRLQGVHQGKLALRVVPPVGKEATVDLEVPSDSYDVTLK